MGDLWGLWNHSRLERCHLVPRMLGGADCPENLVLLCNECHRDAPDVGDASYMLGWMARREPRFNRIAPLIAEAIEASGWNEEELERLQRDRHLLAEIRDEVIETWTGFHGSQIVPATMACVAAETLRRAGERTGLGPLS